MERASPGRHRRNGVGGPIAQAVLWGVSRTTTFRAAVLLAPNLGENADTTAAVASQLVGAIYGISGIPQDWLDALAWRDRLQTIAERLDAAGWLAGCASEKSAEPTLIGSAVSGA